MKELKLLRSTEQTKNYDSCDWREWFVKKVFSEVTILGSFFSKKPWNEILFDVGKCTFSLVGGVISMMHIFIPEPTDNTPLKTTKMAASMAIGMTAGKVVFNSICSSGAILYGWTRYKNCNSNQGNYALVQQQELSSLTLSHIPDAIITHPEQLTHKGYSNY